jgi:CheY-like chemotaxis protein
MHILLAEDDLVNQKIALQLLTKWGIEVTIANDGNEAIDLIRKNKFNLVLMDLNMPVMDGCMATQHVRASDDPYYQNLPIIAYTASPLADTKEKALSLGMNDFISKPLSPEEMHCKINHYVLTPTLECRPLRIKFDLYTDSNDTDFKTELVSLMMSNMRELQHASYKAYYAGDARIFQTISHKVKSSMILLDDQEFTYAVDDLKHAFVTGGKSALLQEKIIKFNYLSESIVKTLDKEISMLKETFS